jgi:hypothetical protein
MLALKPIPSTHLNNIITSINSRMSNGLEAKERKLLHKNLRGREEREPSRFPLIKQLETLHLFVFLLFFCLIVCLLIKMF